MTNSNIDITSTPITLCKTLEDISKWQEAYSKVVQNSGNNLKGILSDIYGEPTHFMFELLQNADDARATKVKFEIKENKIVFFHNGTKAFTLNDIISITGIGNSTKVGSDKTIGKFGVGFKAVFIITKTPKIWSKTYNFKIENITVPYKINPTELGEWSTIFELEYASDKYSMEETYQRIISEANTLDLQTILFMRHIRELEIESENNRNIILEHTQHEGYSEFSDQTDKSKYLIFNGGQNGQTSISYKLDADGNITKPKNTNVSVFFPTRINSLLGFVVNAPFSTPRTRETIDFSDTYNPILVSEVKEVFTRSILKLRDLGLWTPGMIQGIMPINSELREQSPIYDYLFEALTDVFKSEELVPTVSSNYQLAGRSVVAEDNMIAKLLVYENKDWTKVNSGLDLLKKYYRETLTIPTIYFRDFLKLCTPNYLRQQKTSWLYQFYSYCSDRLEKEFVGEARKFFRQFPIIKSRAGDFVAAYAGDSQNIFLYSKGLDDTRIVDNMFTTHSVSVPEETRHKLVRLLDMFEVKSRSAKSTIELDIMPRWEKADFDTRKELFFRIVKIYNESNKDEKADIVTFLTDKGILYTTDDEWMSEDVYQDTANLNLLLDDPQDVSYIHPDFWIVEYKEREIAQKDGSNKLVKDCQGSNELLEALGVSKGFKVTRKEYGMYTNRFANYVSVFEKYGVPVKGGNIRVEFSYEISSFEEILKSIDSHEKSRALVEELLALQDDWYEGEVGWYTSTRAYNRASTHSVPSRFMLELNKADWIFDKDGKCHSPSEVYEDDFRELYEIQKNVKMLEFIDFKPNIVKSLPLEQQKKLALVNDFSVEELEEFKRKKEAKIENENSTEIVWEDDTRTIVLDEGKEFALSNYESVGSQVQFSEEPHNHVATDEFAPTVRERIEKVAIKTTDNSKQLLGDYGEIKVLAHIRSQYDNAVDTPGGFIADGKKFLLLGKTNPGYDIEVSLDEKIIEYIEVKVRTAESGSVIITNTEWEYAKKFGNKYTIYIVSGINEDKAVLQLQKYNDPYRLSTEGNIFLTPDSYRLS